MPSVFDPLRALPSETIHLGMYLVMGVVLAHARRTTSFLIPHLLVIAAGSAYGAIDEWHQSFVPGRTPAVSDWIADTIGVAVGYAFIMLLPSRRTSPKRAANARQPEHTEGK